MLPGEEGFNQVAMEEKIPQGLLRYLKQQNLSSLTEGCPIYPHRVESSKARVDPTYRKSSGERLSVKFLKEISV